MNTNGIAVKSLYGLVGTVFLLAGATILLFRTGLLPGSVSNLISDIAHHDANALHLLQEFSALLVFVGLITFWFIRHYEQSRAFHWAMTGFWGLIALVHWFDVREPVGSVVGLVVNTIPFALFFLVGLLRLTVGAAKSSSPMPASRA